MGTHQCYNSSNFIYSNTHTYSKAPLLVLLYLTKEAQAKGIVAKWNDSVSEYSPSNLGDDVYEEKKRIANFALSVYDASSGNSI